MASVASRSPIGNTPTRRTGRSWTSTRPCASAAEPLPRQPHEVLRASARWKPTRSAPRSPSSTCARQGAGRRAPRREGDVEEEADPHAGTLLAQHRRDQHELVVVHPDRGALGGERGSAVGEAPVHRDVGVPPVTPERRLGDGVVVERPQGAVGEALVEARPRPPDSGTGTRVMPSCSKTSSGPSGPPSHPTHAPPWRCITGSIAVTRPPGEWRRECSRLSAGDPTRSTGRRLATTVRGPPDRS